MLRIDSFVHRSSLSELISRWMVGKPAPGDVMRLKTIVNFNLYIARLWIDWFARDLLEVFHGVAPTRCSVSTKGQLKDFAITHRSPAENKSRVRGSNTGGARRGAPLLLSSS